MDSKVPSWYTLIKRYRDENLRYISDNKKNLYKIMLSGVFAALISIFVSFLSLPGTVYIYYLISISLIAALGPDTDDKNYPFHLSLSIGMSSVIISMISGFYMLMYYTGDLSFIQSMLSLFSTSLSIIFIMPIYGIFISLFGIASMDAISKLINIVSRSKDESNVENLEKKEENNKKKKLQTEKNHS